MPLDGHSYLVAQGWSGKGSGLRQGSISRPLAIPQKKTLSGLGKDRDEAFPFWDHLFTVAANTIQVKVHKDEDDSSDSEPSTSTPALPTLSRTSTGILSNKRPVSGTPASSSGSSTPCAEASSSTNIPSMSLMARAKREAARRNLYSRFFRGPVLGPDSNFTVEEINEVKSTLIAPVTLEASSIDEVTQPTCEDIMADGQGQSFERQEKKRKNLEKEEKKAKKRDTEGTEMREKDKNVNEKAKLKTKRKDKGKEKELQPTTPSGTRHSKERKRKRTGIVTETEDIQADDRKPKKKRKGDVDQEVELGTGTSVDASRKEDRKRNKETKKRESLVEEDVLAEGTAEHKSGADAKAEKRRRKAEKVEKRRRKGVEAVSSQSVEVELP
ncbi:uncharacterized protein FOMMEDRAFT_171290 [Fomitiporia mediterranea MF3/22]|uniref:uncharacterized protein n=1 Tax=Fomitiporia mediterranea (strain MF3/22) TaxID=694068 RepID=UPI0004407F64|nr:uncharacterized protein FOMMEDRAFT_171290 [Fomitiporia mediterranea MF3/22]EJC97880.1 hypothetical protein FOMMEDRAFT_171290 [Fomitiporia mediterranea MF3/22]